MSRKTIILDLDETCIHTFVINNQIEFDFFNDPEIFKMIYNGDTSYTINVGSEILWGLYRPYLFDFLKNISNYYDIIVWSAGTYNYVINIVEKIFLDHNIKIPKIILTRKDCSEVNNSVIKNLHAIKTIDIKNTLIVDDRYANFTMNPMNGILIPEYNPSYVYNKIIDRSDDNLHKLSNWLLSIKDVSEPLISLHKNNIFI